MKRTSSILTVLVAAIFWSCVDSTGNKGTLTLSLTDSPVDADNVKSVNLFITNIEAQRGGDWKSLRHFDQPTGINLLEYTGGKSLQVVDQFVDPGSISKLKFTLNLADPNSSLIHNPQCNIGRSDGSTAPIYYFEPGTIDMIVEASFGIASHGHTDITLDVDVRKSFFTDAQGTYIFKPSVRLIETAKAGHIAGSALNHNSNDRIVVYAYKAGQYNSSELATPAPGEVRFKNAVSSGKLSTTKFGIGFLETGTYDLVFARNDGTGELINVLGRQDGVAVQAGQTITVTVDLNNLTGS